MTKPTARVLAALIAAPTEPRYGLDLMHETGLKSGTLYPILERLQTAGWIESAWEAAAVHEAAGRPRRRYYRLAPSGAEPARLALAQWREQAGSSSREWGAVPATA